MQIHNKIDNEDEKFSDYTRNVYLDVVKAVAIIFVLVGHSIQFGTGTTFEGLTIFEYWAFKYIYSFHMPLFMIVSGFLFKYSSDKYVWHDVIRRKIAQLLIPIICWSLIPFIADVFIFKTVHMDMTIIGIIKRYASITIRNLWFLWAIFLCSIATELIKQYLKNNVFFHILLLIAFFFVPDSYNLHLYKFMYPFFIVGYYYNGNFIYKKLLGFSKKVLCTMVMAVAIIYVFGMSFYNTESYIYISGYTLLGKDYCDQILIDVYRFLIGLLGSVVVMGIIWCCYQFILPKLTGWMSYIGKNTLGIYIVSGYIYNYILPSLTQDIESLNWGLILVECAVILAVSILIDYVIKRFKVLSTMLLGVK